MLYLIDKPLGISSFDVIRKLRVLLGKKKMGHTGTLDPLATGCLLIATEDYTKYIPLLEKYEKTYYFEMMIDGTTPSLDLGTEITYHDISLCHEKSQDELRHYLESMTEQTPPSYSALHIDGERAYERVKRGGTFTLPKRTLSLRDIEIIRYDPPFLALRVTISSGGYIRSLAHDIGVFYGLPGGYITHLRRESIHFPNHVLSITSAQSLDSFDSNQTIDIWGLLTHIKRIYVDDITAKKLENGIIPYNFLPNSNFKVGDIFFVENDTKVISLLELGEKGFIIKRNNLPDSHKIRRE